MPKPVNSTKSIANWSFQENYVERLMDDASFTAAHPNNTLVLAGPARLPKGGAGKGLGDVMLPIGMVAQMSVACSRPLQPMQAVGSGRTFFLAGKGQVSFNVGRLWVNGRNLLRALYTNAVQAGLEVNNLGDAPIASQGGTRLDNAWFNLDSELFYVPFGMAVIFKNVAQQTVGAFYIELCMLNSWSVNFGAGQNMIMENVSGMGDRVAPILPDDLGAISSVKGLVDQTTLVYGGMMNQLDQFGDDNDAAERK